MSLLRNDVADLTDASQILNFIDYQNSKESIICDIDGNRMIDMVGTETIPLGYNHVAFYKGNTKNLDRYLINSNVSTAHFPATDFNHLLD